MGIFIPSSIMAWFCIRRSNCKGWTDITFWIKKYTPIYRVTMTVRTLKRQHPLSRSRTQWRVYCETGNRVVRRAHCTSRYCDICNYCQTKKLHCLWKTTMAAWLHHGNTNRDKNIKRHTAHTIVSWPNPKQWILVHTSDLMMIIRQSNILSQPSRGNWVNWK